MPLKIIRPTLRIGIIILGLVHVQCTWTPKVQTPIFANERGTVALQTSTSFKTPPSHPATLSQPLLQTILDGIQHFREGGILQELLSSPSSQPTPLFSQPQVNFLVPHLLLALSQATPEEQVGFSCSAQSPSEASIKGSLTIFDSHIIFLIIETSKDSSGSPYVLPSQRRVNHESTYLDFLVPEAILPLETVQTLIETPQKSHWIAINYGTLTPGEGNEQPTHSPQTQDPPQPSTAKPRIEDLKENIQRLRQEIEEQSQELQRLQNSKP